MQLEEILLFFAGVIEKELGIVYSKDNYFQLQNRLEEISNLLGKASLADLHAEGKKGIHGQFRQLLLDIATNNETSFFRDPKLFRAIENQILPDLLSKQQLLPSIKIWSAASSSGQEALSVAMTLLEWSKKNGKSLDFSITGTDISDRILAKAKAARYSQLEIQRGLPAPMMIRYFAKDATDHWEAKADLTRHMQFSKLNLTEPFPFQQKFDVVLCRNVLIYQNVERKAQIIKKIHSVLAPGGYLVLGAAESLFGLSDQFYTITADGAVLFQKKLETESSPLERRSA